MKRILVAVPILLLAGCVDTSEPLRPSRTPSPGVGRATDGSPFVAGQVLARFQPGVAGAAIANAHGANLRAELLLPGIWLLDVPIGAELFVAGALARNPQVVFAEPDWLLSTTPCELSGGCPSLNDPIWSRKWDLNNDGVIRQGDGSWLASTGKVDADIDWLEAYATLGETFGGSAVIGILDTGIRNTHEDLAGKVWKNRNFDGFIFIDPNQWNDSQGHGTHVSGIAAAAANNGKGLAGVGYGPNIRLINARVCGSLGCATSSIANGIRWATDEGANILNLSLGGPNPQTAIRDALQYATARNVLPFCAAGNNGTNAVSYPAAFSECVAVGSTTWSDTRASYSNWGPEVELSAPGGDTNPEGTSYSYIASAYYSADNAYVYMSGTSMASPQAAGLAALVYAAGIKDAAALRAHLRSTVDDLGPAGWDPEFGHGRINAYRAIKDIEDTGSPGEPGPPGDPDLPEDPGTPGDPGDPEPPADPVVASFSYKCNNSGTCSFTDTSTGGVTGWGWSFQGGNPATSNLQNPSTTFSTAGTHVSVLVVGGSDGSIGSAVAIINCTLDPRQRVRCR